LFAQLCIGHAHGVDHYKLHGLAWLVLAYRVAQPLCRVGTQLPGLTEHPVKIHHMTEARYHCRTALSTGGQFFIRCIEQHLLNDFKVGVPQDSGRQARRRARNSAHMAASIQ
jgi:hypothetical protein